MKHCARIVFILLTVWDAGFRDSAAQVPQLLNYQGRIQTGANFFEGTARFKFALVGGSAANFATYWSNDGTSANGLEPQTAVNLPVSKGLYSVLLGDATRQNMTILPTSAFASSEVYLRVWFSDGTTGFQQLSPDQRIAAVGYAIMAASVADASITAAKLADGAVTTSKLAPDAVTAAQIADGSISQVKLDSQLGVWQKTGGALSHSGGVGIGTPSPATPLEVVSSTPNLAIFNSSASVGTYLGLKNTGPDGDTWWLGSSGSTHIEGPGNLLFIRGSGGSPKMQLDGAGNLGITGDLRAKDVNVSGDLGAKNLNVSGTLTARNMPFLTRVQKSPPQPEAFRLPHNVDFMIDELSVSIPADGFLMLFGYVSLSGTNFIGYGPNDTNPNVGGPQTRADQRTRFRFWIERAPAHPAEPFSLTRRSDEYQADNFNEDPPHSELTWCVQVEAGVYQFRTRGHFIATNSDNNVGALERGLTAIFIPSRPE